MPLDVEAFKASSEHKISIGKLTTDMVNFLGLSRGEADIILWKDRIAYVEGKHKNQFSSCQEYEHCISCMPEVIQDPDYLGIHPTSQSVEFIKKMDDLFIVAVRLTNKGELYFRTAFPLTEKQLADYLAQGTVKKYRK
jgi:hypothetical protein